MAGTIDTNTWYEMFYGSDTTQAIVAADINSSGSGAVVRTYLNATTNQSQFQWQFLRLNTSSSNSVYVIRSRYLGNQWYFKTFWQPLTSLPGLDTRCYTYNYKSPDLAATSAQWIVDSVGDGTGTWYLSTVANGTGVHLDSYQGVLWLKDANNGVNTNTMKWTLKSMTAINDQQWSYTPTASATLTLVTSTASAPASNSATATGTSGSSSQSASSSGGSSTPIGAIVGGVVGGVLALIILAVVLILLRRRKRKRTAAAPASALAPPPPMEYYGGSPYPVKANEIEGKQLYGSQCGPVARPVPGIYEKDPSPMGHQQPAHQQWTPAVELPADSAARSLSPMFSTSTRSGTTHVPSQVSS